MATLKKTLATRAQLVKDVRKAFHDGFKVRKGWRYVILQCRGCNRLFQVPYKEPGRSFAFRALEVHKGSCKGY